MVKSLVVGLLVVASLFFIYSISVSVFSPEMDVSITGFATQSGTINLSVNTTYLVNFTQENVDWGAGSITSSPAILDSQAGTVTGGSWGSVSDGFIVKNVRNGNVSLKLKSGKDADSFIGGTAPDYQYYVSNVNDSACIPPSGFSLGTFYDVNTTGDGTLICEKFLPGLEVKIDLKLTIPDDSDKGSLTDSFSITLTEA